MDKPLDLFVEDLKKRQNCLAIAIFGSYARGQQRPNSDIDVFVVVPEGTWRDIETFHGQLFEMVYASADAALSFYQENPNDAVQQWKDLQVIYDPQNLFEEIRAKVEEIKTKGKARPSDSSIKHLKFDVEDKIRAAEYLFPKDEGTATYYLTLLGEQLFNAYFDLHQIWTPAPKQRFIYLREHDPETAHLFLRLFCEQPFSNKIASAKNLAIRIFGT